MTHDIISLRPVRFGVLTLLTLVWIAAPQRAAGQNTAFTYQGRLNAGGGPANGVYDFSFQAFDALTGGSSAGGTVNVNGVGVTNGLFTALVDLGTTPFTGPARWLQISVSTNGAGNFTILTPRQPLTPSPCAICANTAGTVTNGAIANAQLAANAVAAGNIQNSTITAGKIASGQVVKSLNGLTDAVSLTQGANVTINTVGNSLQISAPAGGLNLPFSGSAASGGPIFTLANSGTGAAGVFLGSVGIGTTNTDSLLTVGSSSTRGTLNVVGSAITVPVMTLSDSRDGGRQYSIYGGLSGVGTLDVFDQNAVANRLTIGPAGNVGIGTTTPQARLDVRGDVRLGPNGEFRATSGEENLRIVRGTISASGIVLKGSGFRVHHPVTGSGEYTIDFIPDFPGFDAYPAVTATAITGDSIFVTVHTQSSGDRVRVTVHDVSTGNDSITISLLSPLARAEVTFVRL
jgi:hypothetical protein